MKHLEENHQGYIDNIGVEGKLDNMTRNPEKNKEMYLTLKNYNFCMCLDTSISWSS